jgi:hypothetical protein
MNPLQEAHMFRAPLSLSRCRRAAAVAVLSCAAALAAGAGVAQADSIAYIKGGNVWLSTSDGSRQFQVTSTGDYSDVSQADDGTMIALSGVRLRKLDRLGTVLADFATPVSDTSPAPERTFYGPFDPAISPDGTKVAYTYYYMSQSQDNTCFPPQCVTAINEAGTGYSFSDRYTNWNEPGLTEHSGWRNPFWVDNATTVLSDPTHIPNDDVVVDQPGSRPGDTGFLVKGWFSDSAGGNPHVSGGDISRDRSKMAFVTGDNDSTLTIYHVGSFPTAFPDGEAAASDRPEICYRYSHPVGGSFGTPTFSPDGAHVAFAVGDGINVVDVPNLSGGCTTAGASANSRLLIPGASQPDWGPADVPANRPGSTTTTTPGSTTTTPGSTTTTPGTTTTTPRSGHAHLTIAGGRLRAVLGHGLSVTVTGVAPRATVRLTARVGHRLVAAGRGRSTASGTVRIRLGFTRSGARWLRSARRVTLTVAGAGSPVRVTLHR